MAFGQDLEGLESILEEMAQLVPGDLEALMHDEQEQTDEVEDGHLVAYMDECIKESFQSSKERREKDQTLWDAHETKLAEMAKKESWQSSIVLNKPFTTCLQAKSLVRRGLIDRPEYFSITPTPNQSGDRELKAKFWEKSIKYWTGTPDAYLPFAFADASEMGFAVGVSMCIKLLWEEDENGVFRLKLNLFEPWKSYPDPDRLPRRPWSGLYNIHEEWVDFHVLKEKEEKGFYENVDQVRMGKSTTDGSGMSFEERDDERKKKKQTMVRNKYRKSVLTREFWGTILDTNGDVVMHNASFTVANGIVIRKAQQNPMRRLRWPWVDFSPLPHLFRDHGYSIYEGTLSTWKFQNALLNLYIDNENWRINNMFEIDPSKLLDPTDTEAYPGKKWLLKRGAQGPAIVPVLKGQSNVQEFDMLWRVATNNWETGTFVSPIMKGEDPRRKITAREYEGTKDTGEGVFGSIGRDVELGGTDLIWAVQQILTTYWDNFDTPSFEDVFGQDNELYHAMMLLGELAPEERIKMMELDCQFKVEGVSKLFDESKIANDILQIMEFGGGNPGYESLKEHEEILRAFVRLTDKEDLIKTKEKVEQEQAAEAQAQQKQAIQAAVDSASSVADKAMGVDLDAPGSTQQQQIAARGDLGGQT